MRPMRVYTLYVSRLNGSTTISTQVRRNELPIGSGSEAKMKELERAFAKFLQADAAPKDSTLVTSEVILDAVDKFLRKDRQRAA